MSKWRDHYSGIVYAQHFLLFSNISYYFQWNRFAKTPGLARIVEWIKEGRKEIDLMEGPYDGEQQPKEAVQIVVNAIKTLSRAPPEYRPSESSRLIKHLTNDVAYPEGNLCENLG